MTDRTHFGLTIENLSFGAEVPEGMPPGPFLAGFLSMIYVSKLSGFDQIVVLRAHQRIASHYEAATDRDISAVNESMLTFDGYPQREVEATEMAAASPFQGGQARSPATS